MPVLDTIFTRMDRLSKKRLAICKECSEFVASTSQCNKCSCLMNLKTMLPFAECPLNKWGRE